MSVKDEDFEGYAEGGGAIDGLARFARDRMFEREKTKRPLIGAVCVLTIFAALSMLFAPQGREQVGYIIGAVLLVIALGAIGASKFILKLPGVQLDTRNQAPLDTSHHATQNKSKDWD